MTEIRPYDTHFMTLALRLGRRNIGNTGPNPAVGCLIVDESCNPPQIIAAGWTGRGGRPHAEQVALEHAGDKARGATAYVTLEPCAHYGKTPPCAKGLAEAGVARVVTTCVDPDPRVSGRGHAMLQEAGISVVTGVMAAEARQDMVGFLTRMTLGRPHMILKLAVSADGKIAAQPGLSTTITGEEARARSHLMRAESDVILVGRNTILIDNPALTCRLPGLGDRSPIRAVVASEGLIPPRSVLANTARKTPVWILSAREPDNWEAETLLSAGVEILVCGEGKGRRVDLGRALATLGDRGVGRVMVEGGAQIAAGLLAADLVDEVALFTSRKELGDEAVDALGGTPIKSITESARFALNEEEWFGEDRLTVYVRAAAISG